MARDFVWKNHPARGKLRTLYDEVDALFASMSCDKSTECCRFGVTGREPYPTAVEIAELVGAVKDKGLVRKLSELRRRLPISDERRCPLLSEAGVCTVYASRPFGCRSFFCSRADGHGSVSRAAVQRISRDIAALSDNAFPADPGPRPLSRVLERLHSS